MTLPEIYIFTSWLLIGTYFLLFLLEEFSFFLIKDFHKKDFSLTRFLFPTSGPRCGLMIFWFYFL